MMTVGSRESVSTPQGVGIKPTGHTFAPTRRVGLSTFPLATDPVSTAISESLSHFGLAADFCSSSVSSFLKSSRSRSGSRATLGPIRADVAVASVDGLSQQGHRLVGVGLSLGGRHARALLPGETRERGVGAGDGESRIAFLQPQPFREPQCMPDVGRRAGGVAQSPAGPPALDQRSDPVSCVVLSAGFSLINCSKRV